MSNSKPPPIYRARLTGPEAGMRRFLATYPLEPQSVKFTADAVSIDVFVTDGHLQQFDRFGLKVEDSFDATARGQDRRREIGVGNRFAGGRIPAGLGAKHKKQEAT